MYGFTCHTSTCQIKAVLQLLYELDLERNLVQHPHHQDNCFVLWFVFSSSDGRWSLSLLVLLLYLSLHFIGVEAGLFVLCLFLHQHFGICSYHVPFGPACESGCSLGVGLLLDVEMTGEIGAPDGVFSKQRQFQAIHKLTHLKGPYDRVSSVIIPGILLATCFTLVGRGVYHLATGTGVKAGA